MFGQRASAYIGMAGLSDDEGGFFTEQNQSDAGGRGGGKACSEGQTPHKPWGNHCP